MKTTDLAAQITLSLLEDLLQETQNSQLRGSLMGWHALATSACRGANLYSRFTTPWCTACHVFATDRTQLDRGLYL